MLDSSFYSEMNSKGNILREGIEDILVDNGLDYHVAGLSSMFQVYLTEREVWNYDDAKTAQTEKFSVYFHTLLKKGVFIPPSQFECCFLSIMHSEEDIQKTLESINYGMKTIKNL